MKRIMAFLVAMLMAFGMAAVAETADFTNELLTMGNFVVRSYDAAGNATETPLTDLYCYAGIDVADGLRFIFELDEGEEALAYELYRLAGNKLQVSRSSEARGFEYALPEVPGFDYAMLGDLIRAALARGIETHLDMIPVPTIPMLDMSGPLERYVTRTEEEEEGEIAYYFTIPADQISMLMRTVNGLAKLYAASVPQAAGALELLDQLVESGISFEIDGGHFTGDGMQVVEYDIYVASGEQIDETPLLTVYTVSQENHFTLILSLPIEGSEDTMDFAFGVRTDPAANTMDFGVNFADLGTMELNFDRENDLQNIILSVDGTDTSAKALFSYGVVDGLDYVALSASADDMGSLSIISTGAKQDDELYLGHMDCELSIEDTQYGLSCDYAVTLGDADLSDFEMPAEFSTDGPTDAETQAFAQPLLDYFEAIFPDDVPAA